LQEKIYEAALVLAPHDTNLLTNFALFKVACACPRSCHASALCAPRRRRTHEAFARASVTCSRTLLQEESDRDIAGARRLLEHALELDPRDIDCRTYYASLLQERCSEHELAQRQFEKTVELDPANVKLLCKYGAFLEDQPCTDAQASDAQACSALALRTAEHVSDAVSRQAQMHGGDGPLKSCASCTCMCLFVCGREFPSITLVCRRRRSCYICARYP
jgi:tetratricopeptide (TPR) repeat protein